MAEASDAIDIAAALHALAFLVDEDRPLPGLASMGLGVLLKQLADRLDALGGALLDREHAA